VPYSIFPSGDVIAKTKLGEMASVISLPTEGSFKGQHSIGPFDFLNALPTQALQLLLVYLAHRR
jgi:hypothetical protein